MPKLPTIAIQTQASSIGSPLRQREPVTAVEQATTNFGKSVSGIGELLQRRQEQIEVSDLNAKTASFEAEFSNAHREFISKADPTDTQAFTEFSQQWQDQLSGISEGVSTRAGQLFLERRSASMKSRMSQQMDVAQVELAKERAMVNWDTMENSYAGKLFNNPEDFDSIRAESNRMLEQFVTEQGLDRQSAIKLGQAADRKYAVQAVRGVMDLSPEEAEAQLKSGKWDALVGDVKSQLMGEIETHKRAREADAARAVRLREEQIRQQSRDSDSKWTTKILSKEEAVSAKDIAKDPTLLAPAKRTLVALLNSPDTKLKDNGPHADTLFERIHLEDGHPDKIFDPMLLTQARINGKITDNDLKDLRKELDNRLTPEGQTESELKKSVLDAAKALIVKRNQFNVVEDPNRVSSYNRYKAWFMQEYAKRRKDGKTAAELTNPKSKDYLGQFIDQFNRAPEEIMRDQFNKISNPTKEIPIDIRPVAPLVPDTSVPGDKTNEPPNSFKKNPIGKEPTKRTNESWGQFMDRWRKWQSSQ